MQNVHRFVAIIPTAFLISCGYLETKVSEPDGSVQPAVKGCTVAEAGEGRYVISCPDGTSATIRDGKDGAPGSDGRDAQCSVAQTGDGVTIKCSDGTEAHVANGKDGKDGADGLPGQNGRDGKDGAPGPATDPGNDGFNQIVTIEKNYARGTSTAFNKPVDRDGVITLPAFIKVVYGNAGNYTARICINSACCTYKGGASTHAPLNPGQNDNGNRALKLSEIQDIEKGKLYKFVGCDPGLDRKAIPVKRYDHVWAGIDHGDSTMETIAEFFISFK